MAALKNITRIYGASDDLVEMDGEIYDEHGEYRSGGVKHNFYISDGTKGTIEYGKEGIWIITIKHAGSLYGNKIPAIGDEGEHAGDAHGCSSYSDVLIMNSGVEWIKIGRKKYT